MRNKPKHKKEYQIIIVLKHKKLEFPVVYEKYKNTVYSVVFNYVRNGAKTNQIYTGSVSFSFTEGNDGIYLTDQYPTLYVDTVVKGASTDREKISLNINAIGTK